MSSHTALHSFFSFFLSCSLDVTGLLPFFQDSSLSFTSLCSPLSLSTTHPCVRLSHALCLILWECPKWSSKCFFFFFLSPDSQILSGAVWDSVVTSLSPLVAPPPTPYLPHCFSRLFPDKVRLALSLSAAHTYTRWRCVLVKLAHVSSYNTLWLCGVLSKTADCAAGESSCVCVFADLWLPLLPVEKWCRLHNESSPVTTRCHPSPLGPCSIHESSVLNTCKAGHAAQWIHTT